MGTDFFPRRDKTRAPVKRRRTPFSAAAEALVRHYARDRATRIRSARIRLVFYVVTAVLAGAAIAAFVFKLFR